MSDKEYRECLEKLIEGGRAWDAMYELQGYARNYINNMEMAIREARQIKVSTEECKSRG